MTVYGYCGVGVDDDVTLASIRGNGKTMTMVYYLYCVYLLGWRVITNFKTTFSEYMSVDAMIQLFLKEGENLYHVAFAIDEIANYVDSYTTKPQNIKHLMIMIAQLRKRHVDLHWTCQRYMDVAKKIRKQTDIIVVPVKSHTDRTPCYQDTCEEKEHLIWVFLNKPYVPRPEKVLIASELGVMYNSDEVILDEIHVPSTKVDQVKA